MRRIMLLPALGLGLVLLARLGQAQVPETQNSNAPGQPGGLNNLVQSNREDVNAAYAVTPEAGPWMICVGSYQGESSSELAFLLCTYLRQKHYPAYVFNRGNAERKQLQEELDQRQKMYPGLPRRRLAHPQEDQFAVLLAGFNDPDTANAMLKKVRKWDLPDIKLKSGKPAFDTYDLYEKVPDKKSYELKRYPVNPFHTAFVVPNPTLPPQRKAAAKVDPFWKRLNADEPRSLFKCPKPWTLAVQEFHGATAIQSTSSSSGFLEKLGFDDHHTGKRLDNAARMAQEVSDMFKKLGYKSYVLHTRINSVVTVGEFDGPNDPALLRTQEQLSKMSFKTKTGETAFNLFAKALPMEVPR